MVSLFTNISSRERTKLLRLLDANTLSYKKDMVILSTFHNEAVLGIMTKGSAKIIRTDYNGNRIIIEELDEGSIFSSYLYSLNNKEYQIIASEDSELILIDYDYIFQKEINSPSYIQFVKNCLQVTNQKILETNHRIEILTKKTIRDKLLEYFNMMSKKSGSRNIYLPFTFTDLADFLAVDRSAMSRELRYLKEEGFIQVKKRKITLLY